MLTAHLLKYIVELRKTTPVLKDFFAFLHLCPNIDFDNHHYHIYIENINTNIVPI